MSEFSGFCVFGDFCGLRKESGCNLILRYTLLSAVFELSIIPSVYPPAVIKGCELKHLNFLILVFVYGKTIEVELRNNLDNHLQIQAH